MSQTTAATRSTTDTPGVVAPGATPNLLKNPGFNQTGGPNPPPMTVTVFGYLPSAAPFWDVDSNQPGVITSVLLPSTRSGKTGEMMLQVCTDAIQCGVRQVIGPLNSGPSRTISGAWVYVLFGRVGIGTGNAGGTGDHDCVSTTIGAWEYLQAPNGTKPANYFVINAIDAGGACFFVDDASVCVDLRPPKGPTT